MILNSQRKCRAYFSKLILRRIGNDKLTLLNISKYAQTFNVTKMNLRFIYKIFFSNMKLFHKLLMLFEKFADFLLIISYA